jgi:hypothetical protein
MAIPFPPPNRLRLSSATGGNLGEIVGSGAEPDAGGMFELGLPVHLRPGAAERIGAGGPGGLSSGLGERAAQAQELAVR